MQTFEQDFNRIFAKYASENGKEDSTPLPEKEPEDIYVYIEPDRMTFIKSPEPQPQAQVIVTSTPAQPQTPPYFAYIAMTISLLLLCYLVTSAIITTFFPPTITVTILTKSQTIKTSGTIQLQARILPPITLSESQTVKTTGRAHQDAKSANGYITFYNGQFQSVSIPAGKTLTGSDGTPIITDQNAVIPAANLDPPTFGKATVSAHAINPGSNGNIVAYDINNPCCFASVIAKNTASFTGGQDERDFKTVTQADINGAAATLKTTLAQSMQGALQTQQKQGEALITLPCSPRVSTDHPPGYGASTVQVTISETCSSIAYNQDRFITQATQTLAAKATKVLGAGYTLFRTVQVSIHKTTVTNNGVALAYTAQGAWIYALSKQTQQHITQLLTGKRKQDAIRLLLSLPGIQQAVITGIDDLRKLPKDPPAIHILVIIPESS